MIESNRDTSYQIHHPNDFLVRGRVFAFSHTTYGIHARFDCESNVTWIELKSQKKLKLLIPKYIKS